MSFIIALAGKGGTGKTTIAGLLVRALAERGDGPVLAIDADANDNLADALGMRREGTIAEVTDAFFTDRIDLPAGMTKEAFLDMRLNTVIAEGKNIDMLIMGHPERAGCYCYINNVLRAQLERLVGNYAYVVIDNEAGMEHISRRTTRKLDALVAVADCSAKAIRAAGRIRKLAGDLEIAVGRAGLVVNRVPAGSGAAAEEITQTGLELLAQIPESAAVRDSDIGGRPVFGLPGDDPVVRAVRSLADALTGIQRRSAS
jgi:CO dehydrogenase maturation factor